MSDDLPPFIKWNKSTDRNNADSRIIKVVETEQYETEYSVCVDVQVEENGKWVDSILSLKSHNSENATLLKWWTDRVKRGIIKKGSTLRIDSWIATSKRGHPIRRYRMSVLS